MFSKTTFASMPKILLFTSGLTLEELAGRSCVHGKEAVHLRSTGAAKL